MCTWDVDERGEGVAVYRAAGPVRSYSLVAFAHDLPPEKRTDRVIAEEWDAAFALFDGDPSPADIERLRANVPRQEAGRVSETEIVLARANKSVRLFDHVASCLAAGRQPTRGGSGAGRLSDAHDRGLWQRQVRACGARGDLRPDGIQRAVPGRDADRVPDPRLHARSRRSCGEDQIAGDGGDARARAAAQSRRRQRHRPRHGAVPGQSSGAARSLDHRARNRAGAGPRPVERRRLAHAAGAGRTRAQAGGVLDHDRCRAAGAHRRTCRRSRQAVGESRAGSIRFIAVRCALSMGGERARSRSAGNAGLAADRAAWRRRRRSRGRPWHATRMRNSSSTAA